MKECQSMPILAVAKYAVHFLNLLLDSKAFTEVLEVI